MRVKIISLMKGRQYKLELSNFLRKKRNEIFIASILTSALRPMCVKKEPILTPRTRSCGSFNLLLYVMCILRLLVIITLAFIWCSGLLFTSKPCSHVNGIQEQGLGFFTARLEQISVVVL